jgi:hypothetical protein
MQTHQQQTKYTPDSAVAKLKARERELIDEIVDGDSDKQKSLDALQSVRAALRRWEDAMESKQ